MSYMDQATLEPADGIQELNLDEIEQVDGGFLPILIAGFAAGIAISEYYHHH